MPNPQTAVFPNALATDTTLMVATNRALSTLSQSMAITDTSFVVVDATKFNPPCLVQIDMECVLVTTVAGSVLGSCTRGFVGTTATTHGQNANVKGYIDSYHHNQMAAEIKAIESGLGVGFANVLMRNAPVVFSSLPSLLTGLIAVVTDSTTDTWGATISGSGVYKVLAFCNGTQWTVIGK